MIMHRMAAARVVGRWLDRKIDLGFTGMLKLEGDGNNLALLEGTFDLHEHDMIARGREHRGARGRDHDVLDLNHLCGAPFSDRGVQLDASGYG